MHNPHSPTFGTPAALQKHGKELDQWLADIEKTVERQLLVARVAMRNAKAIAESRLETLGARIAECRKAMDDRHERHVALLTEQNRILKAMPTEPTPSPGPNNHGNIKFLS